MNIRQISRTRLALSGVFVFCIVFNIELAWLEGYSLSNFVLLVGTLLLLSTGQFAFAREQRFWLSLALAFPALYISIFQTLFRESDANTLSLLYLKTRVYVFVAISVYWGLFLRTANGTPVQRVHFVMASVVWAFSVQAMFIAFSFVSPVFREFIDSLLVVKGNLTGLEGFRFKGLANSGGANLSMAMSFAAMMAAYLAIVTQARNYALLALLILAASALVGRSGLVGFAVASMVFLARVLTKGDLSRARTMGALLLFGGLVTVGVAELTTSLEEDVSLWWDWFSGQAGDSAIELWDLYAHEYSVPDLLIGKGFFETELYGASRTDAGYLKTAFSVGVPAAILFYAGLLVIFLTGARAFVSTASNKPIAALFSMLLIFLIFFYESKESMAYQNFTGRLILFGFLLFQQIAPANAAKRVQPLRAA